MFNGWNIDKNKVAETATGVFVGLVIFKLVAEIARALHD